MFIIELFHQFRLADALQFALYVASFFGFVPEEELTLRQLLARCLGTVHGLKRVRVVAGVPRFGAHGHRRRRKVLNLFESEIESLGLYS